MKELQHIHDQNGTFHHAYLIVGDREHARQNLFTFLEQNLNTRVVGNPDFSYNEYATFNIETARNLAIPQSMKDVGGERKFFIIATDGITEEAQNALLKMFEEPTPGTHFFIIAPQNNFLPTFLSRLQVIRLVRENGSFNMLPETLPERLAYVVKLAGDISDEKKTKQDAIDLVNQMEDELCKNESTESLENIHLHAAKLKACEYARLALMSRGAMIKMILENLMLQV